MLYRMGYMDELPSPDSAGSSSNPQSLKKDKLCLVCGDKALGYNFNAVSCESCKAFFRRNAHKTIRGRCEGKCEVTVESRSFCKRCRLAKCFTVGMRKDMILNDEQKRMRKQKIIINKLRRHGTLPPEDTYSVSDNDIKETYQQKFQEQSLETLKHQFPNLSDEEINTLRKIKTEESSSNTQMCLDVTKKVPKYSNWVESSEIFEKFMEDMNEADRLVFNEMNKAHESSRFLANTQTQLKTNPSNPTEIFNIAEGFVRRIIKVAKQLEFFRNIDKDDQIALLKGSVVEIMMLRSAVNFDVVTETWNLSTSSCLSKGLSSSVSSPSAQTLPLHSGDMPSSSSSQTSVSGQTNSTSNSVPGSDKSAGMPSAVPLNIAKAFPGIPPNMNIDQLRELGARMGFTRENMMPNMDTPQTETESSDQMDTCDKMSASKFHITSHLLKMGNSETRTMFLTYSKFIKALMTTIYGDLIVLKFLVMLSLFSPDRQGLEDRDKIERYQEVYATLLQKYTAQRFPEEKTMFAKCLMKLTDLRNVNEVHTKMLLKMNVDDIEPLLLEIFDL